MFFFYPVGLAGNYLLFLGFWDTFRSRKIEPRAPPPPWSPISYFLGPSRGGKGWLGMQNCKNWLSKVNFWLSEARNGATRIARIARIAIIDFLGPETSDSDCSDCSDCNNWLWNPKIAIIGFRKSIIGFRAIRAIRAIRAFRVEDLPTSNSRAIARELEVGNPSTQLLQYWTFKVNYCKNPFRAIRVAPGSKTHFEQSESPEQSESTRNLRTNKFWEGQMWWILGGNISCPLFPAKIGLIALKIVTETSPHSSHRSSQEAKEGICTSCSLWGQSHVKGYTGDVHRGFCGGSARIGHPFWEFLLVPLRRHKPRQGHFEEARFTIWLDVLWGVAA